MYRASESPEARPGWYNDCRKSGHGSTYSDGGLRPEPLHVLFCQSGVRVTQTLFALYLAGYPIEHLHVYDSSWIHWGNAPETPIVDPAGKAVVYTEE